MRNLSGSYREIGLTQYTKWKNDHKLNTAELCYVEVVGTQNNTSTQEWFDLTKWALWGANNFDKVSVLKRMLTFKHIILPFKLISFIGEYKIKR